MLPTRPISPYGATKLAAEHLCRAYAEEQGVPVVVLRYFSVYGPRQRPDMGYHKFIKALLRGERITVYGDGQQIRGNTYVDDCVDATLAAVEGQVGEVYNVGGRAERTNLELTYALLDALHKPRTLIRYVKDRPGHDRRYAIDCGKIERELGWRPTVTFEEGLQETIEWYRTHGDWVSSIRTGDYLKYYEKQYGSRDN